MSTDIAATLNEHRRTALLSYYLGQYIPASDDDTLKSLVQTPEDVYEYLLIDPLVSNAVPTSRVAQAMSSIQQYINGITLSMEPGYQIQDLDPAAISDWKAGLSQYDIWAGEVELDTYPENYIDPTLRQNQTAYFKDLINSLNQNTLSSDTAQQAVMNYLNSFEQVANLEIISGYLNGSDPLASTYYFLGKTRSSPVQYYWRSFDMSQDVNNVVATNAWSEWYPMKVSINDDACAGKPRPVFFNNRLYVIWFEQITIDNGESGESAAGIPTFNALSSYCQFNNQWSAPYILATMATDADASSDYGILSTSDIKSLNTVAAHIVQNGVESLCCSLYFYNTNTSKASEFSLSIDYWFCTITVKDNLLGIYYATFAGGQQQLVQYQLTDAKYTYTLTAGSTSDTFPQTPAGMLTKIKDLSTADCTQDASTGALTITSTFTVTPSNYTTTSFTNLQVQNANNGSAIGVFDGTFQIDASVKRGIFNGTMTSSSIPGGYMVSSLLLFNNNSQQVSVNNPSQSVSSSSVTFTDVIFNLNNFTWDTSTPCKLQMFFSDNVTSFRTVEFSPSDEQRYTNLKDYTYKDTWNAGTPLDNADPTTTPGTQTLKSTLSTATNTPFFMGITGTDAADSTPYQSYRQYALSIINTATITSPSINQRVDTTYGTVQYLDFTNITFYDGTPVDPLRLNTLFAKELINKASISLSSLLSWETQFTLEPGMTSTTPVPMDFSDSNGIYFWELFFYMPYLVAWRLFQEQIYDDAQAWYNYIFDPSACGRTSDDSSIPAPPDFWSVRPLVEVAAPGAQGASVSLTTDPDALASADPVHYRKAIFMAYVSNLMATGDASYRLLTNDGLSFARLQYGEVKDLLGPRPDVLIVNHWAPETLADLAASAGNSALLTGVEQQTASLPAVTGRASAADTTTTSDCFMAPLNTQLLSYWNTLDSRLYNLRHQLTLDGQPMIVPLYAPPVNPTLLMEQSVQGGSLISTSSGIVASVPPYRFSTLLQSARSAVATLSQFGQTLLSYCERQDATGLQELDTQLAFNISGYTLTLQQNAIDAMDKDRDTLNASLAMAQQRRDHYQALYDQNMSAGEIMVMELEAESGTYQATAAPLLTAGMMRETLPNIFGLADGGRQTGAPEQAAGLTLQITADVIGLVASITSQSEGYKRRRAEWQIQYQQAQSEMDVVNTQLDVLAVRRTGAVTALQLAQAQQDNLKSTLTFLTTRFTQSALYNWLTGQLSALYYQAYDATLSLCLSAEACWQYEMGDITSRFIQTNAWNDNYLGLLVGETLQLNLQQMESAWLNRYTRRLEITKTVSLKTLLTADDWSALQASGVATFGLTENLFDQNYPGHYLRQIKSVTVGLPALVGPYQDVCMTLTQTASKILLKADAEGVKYLNDSTTGSSTNILLNPRASQQVAVSSGLNDAGLFILNFGDERYLPFEGTGAVSDWQIAFPNPTSSQQATLLASLNDVIIQVRYTALYGGAAFEQAVTETLTK
jgi:hypothetical protein